MKLSEAIFSLAKLPVGDLVVGIAFGKLNNLLPVKKIMETDKAIAFWHPKPFWEKHILVVPKKAIKNLTSVSEKDYPYINDVFKLTKEIVSQLNWHEGGYSVLINGGDRQEVGQLHFHLFSGKELK
jgi:histidine triad (HIT) family protein